MTLVEVVGYGAAWYAFWGVAGHLTGRWYAHRLSNVSPVVPLAYTIVNFAPLLYTPFLDAVAGTAALFGVLPVVIAFSLVPTLIKLRAVSEIVQRRKRGRASRPETAVVRKPRVTPVAPHRRRPA